MYHPGTNNKVYKKINNNFEWSKENFNKITEILKKYPSNKSQSAVIPLLDLAQRQNQGWLSKNFVQICRTTPCWLRGSEKLSKVAQEVCDTQVGKTSDDKKFTVVEVECLGACCNAPMIQINDEYYEDLDEDNFRKLLIDLKSNRSIKKGSQIGRKSSQPERDINA